MKLAPEKRDRPVVADVGTAAAAAAAAAMVAEIAASAEISKIASIHFRRRGREFGQGWIRTSEGVKPADLQSAPFGHSGTYPFASVDIGSRSTCCKSALRRGSLHSALGEDGPPMPSSLLLTPAFRPVVRAPTMRRKPFQRLSCGLQRNHRPERPVLMRIEATPGAHVTFHYWS